MAGSSKDCISALLATVTELEHALRRSRKVLEAGDRMEKANLQVKDVLSYARHISGTTSAPHWWTADKAVPGVGPCPPNAWMRRGALMRWSTGTALREEPTEEAEGGGPANGGDQSPTTDEGTPEDTGRAPLPPAPSYQAGELQRKRIILDLDELDSDEDEDDDDSGMED